MELHKPLDRWLIAAVVVDLSICLWIFMHRTEGGRLHDAMVVLLGITLVFMVWRASRAARH